MSSSTFLMHMEPKLCGLFQPNGLRSALLTHSIHLFLAFTSLESLFGRSEVHLAIIFLTMYAVIAVYYMLRFIMQRTVRSAVLKSIPEADEIIIAPTMRFNQWRLAVTSKDCFYVGRAYKRSITIFDKFKRVPVPETPIIEAAKKDKNISAFLSFSPVYRWDVSEYDHYYEVSFIDLRYRSNGHYPFVAIVQLDFDLDIITSYTGWIFSEEKLKKKVKCASRLTWIRLAAHHMVAGFFYCAYLIIYFQSNIMCFISC